MLPRRRGDRPGLHERCLPVALREERLPLLAPEQARYREVGRLASAAASEALRAARPDWSEQELAGAIMLGDSVRAKRALDEINRLERARVADDQLYALRDDAMRFADDVAERRSLNPDWVRNAIGQAQFLDDQKGRNHTATEEHCENDKQHDGFL